MKWIKNCAMDANLIIGLISFAFVTSITPGPNNLMLMASGANFGFRRSLWHMLGINLGFASLVAVTGFGLGSLIAAVPAAKTALKIAATLYMLWLAWKIAHAAAPAEGRVASRPMTILQAAAFQWVNPKAWAMALGAVSAYSGAGDLIAVLRVVAVFSFVNMPCIATWVLMGEGLRHILTNPNRLQVFNWTMATLLVLSLWPVLDL
jgi:threonine/homoserine/homoserine lactone efflux protein